MLTHLMICVLFFHRDGDNMDETAKNWDDSVLKSVPSMHINMDPPLTLTAIAKKAIKPVAIEKSSRYDR
jgi:hypothetical protein